MVQNLAKCRTGIVSHRERRREEGGRECARARARESAQETDRAREREGSSRSVNDQPDLYHSALCAVWWEGGREGEKERGREQASARTREQGREAEREKQRGREGEAGPLVASNSRHPAGDWEDSELGMEGGGGRETERWETEREGGGRGTGLAAK